MKNEPAVLEIFLHERLIGTLINLPGDKNLFSFDQEYIDDGSRAVLSLSFIDDLDALVTDVKATRTRLPSFFSNVLPEGYMRDYLASHAHVHPDREFYLLAALGNDLPGAIKIGSAEPLFSTSSAGKKRPRGIIDDGILHFSLAGVQLKFSGIKENDSGLTIPVDGVGGSWIIKLPFPSYAGVPENEYAMMELARTVGIDVPETALVPMDRIKGLPEDVARLGTHAFAIKRFDRDSQGKAVHIEDFAQVFGVYPEKKYRAANYQNIADLVWRGLGSEALVEFIRRFVFNVLIGNGDMHLKNWSLIYPDQRTPKLAPAYDYVSTLPYIPGDGLALNFLNSKSFQALTLDQFKRFAEKTEILEKLVIDTVQETVLKFADAFARTHTFSIENHVHETIKRHLETLPLFTLR